MYVHASAQVVRACKVGAWESACCMYSGPLLQGVHWLQEGCLAAAEDVSAQVAAAHISSNAGDAAKPPAPDTPAPADLAPPASDKDSTTASARTTDDTAPPAATTPAQGGVLQHLDLEGDEDDGEEDLEARRQIYDALAKEDTRVHMNVVFIGHVDAGKSTLGGQILVLMGGVDERTIEKYQKEARDNNRETWYMAYVMDTNDEERAKGKTVEVGRAHFQTDTRRCAHDGCRSSW